MVFKVSFNPSHSVIQDYPWWQSPFKEVPTEPILLWDDVNLLSRSQMNWICSYFLKFQSSLSLSTNCWNSSLLEQTPTLTRVIKLLYFYFWLKHVSLGRWHKGSFVGRTVSKRDRRVIRHRGNIILTSLGIASKMLKILRAFCCNT